jgi:hypothetical protein
MKTLADVLGLPSVEEEMRQRAEAQGAQPSVVSEPEPDPETLSAKDFAKKILNSKEYRQSIRDRIQLHSLPPGIETLFYHYAFGKPVDKLEVNDTTVSLDNVSLDSLKERVSFLLSVIDQLSDESDTAPDTGVTHTSDTSGRTVH